MRAKQSGFWEGETCEYCRGAIREWNTDLHRKVKGKHTLIENVPAGVCTKCGTRYYAANILKTSVETVRRRRKADREVQVSIYSL